MNKDIVIKRLLKGGFDVWIGDKHTDRLTYDELLAVIASICSTERVRMAHHGWFKTDEEFLQERERMRKIVNEPLFIKQTPVPELNGTCQDTTINTKYIR